MSRMRFTIKIEDTTSENLFSLSNPFFKSRLTNSADIKSKINAETNAIIIENSNPRAPIRGKGVSIRDMQMIRRSEIMTLFEKNMSINTTRFNLQNSWF